MFVVFDLDRVLIQNPFLFGVFPEVARVLRPYVPAGVPAEEWRTWIVVRIYERHRDLLMAGDWVASSDWDGIVNHVAQSLGFAGALDVTGLVRAHARPPYIAAYPDAAPALAWLRARARRLYWISNGFARYQLPVMEALVLQNYFDGYFAPDTHDAVKPHKEIYDAILAAAGEPARKGVMIGDSLTTDVAGGRRAGLYTIWLDRTLNPVFHGLNPWDIPHSQLFTQYVEDMIRREFAYEAYRLDVLGECIPDAVITDLTQVPAVIDHLIACSRLQVS